MNLILSLVTLAGSMTGEVTFYNPGVMEAVYANRLSWGHVTPCDDCIGMIAVVGGREALNRRAWLQRPGLLPEGPFLVVDVSNAAHLARQRARGLIAEVDWQTARRWRMVGPLDGVMLVLAPDTPNSGDPYDFTTARPKIAPRPVQ